MSQCCNTDAMTVPMQMLQQTNDTMNVTRFPKRFLRCTIPALRNDCSTALLKLNLIIGDPHLHALTSAADATHLVADSRRPAKGLLLGGPSAARTSGAAASAVSGVAAPIACMIFEQQSSRMQQLAMGWWAKGIDFSSALGPLSSTQTLNPHACMQSLHQCALPSEAAVKGLTWKGGPSRLGVASAAGLGAAAAAVAATPVLR